VYRDVTIWRWFKYISMLLFLLHHEKARGLYFVSNKMKYFVVIKCIHCYLRTQCWYNFKIIYGCLTFFSNPKVVVLWKTKSSLRTYKLLKRSVKCSLDKCSQTFKMTNVFFFFFFTVLYCCELDDKEAFNTKLSKYLKIKCFLEEEKKMKFGASLNFWQLLNVCKPSINVHSG
jgi:hypothetical protein